MTVNGWIVAAVAVWGLWRALRMETTGPWPAWQAGALGLLVLVAASLFVGAWLAAVTFGLFLAVHLWCADRWRLEHEAWLLRRREKVSR